MCVEAKLKGMVDFYEIVWKYKTTGLIVHSVSGRNPVAIEIAAETKKRAPK